MAQNRGTSFMNVPKDGYLDIKISRRSYWHISVYELFLNSKTLMSLTSQVSKYEKKLGQICSLLVVKRLREKCKYISA